MPIIFRTYITKEMMRDNSHWLFIFGDNASRSGYGGQAKVMRDESNSIGIITKRKPTMNEDAFLLDEDVKYFIKKNRRTFVGLLFFILNGVTVVIPSDGIGTGYAELPIRAPKIFKILKLYIKFLYDIGKLV